MEIHKKFFPASRPIGDILYGTIVLYGDKLYIVSDGYTNDNEVNAYPLDYTSSNLYGRSVKLTHDTLVCPVMISEITIQPYSTKEF